MKRISIAFLLTAVIVLMCPAAVRGDVPLSTPTDLCPHERISTKYYFDTPVYVPQDAWTHKVTGRATVEKYCEDCGTVLSFSLKDNAEEIRPHVFRKGKCALCGMESETVSGVQEMMRILLPGEEDGNLYIGVLTVSELEVSGDVLVLRAGIYEPAVALQTKKLTEQLGKEDTLAVEMLMTGERSVNIDIRIAAADGGEYNPDNELVALRVYGTRTAEPLSVLWTDPEGGSVDPMALETSWVDGDNGGYWMSPWPGNGTFAY